MNARSSSFFALLGAATLLLGGCASVSRDAGFSEVGTLARERLGQEVQGTRDAGEADSARAAVRQLLAQPLDAEAALRIALLNNPGLRAGYAELGIAEADWVQASRMRNPGFSFQRTRAGDEVKIERGLTVDLLGLLTLPAVSRIEGRRFEQTRLAVAGEVLRVATETRKAWARAVAAEQGARYMEQVKSAAEAGAELARGMARAGNWSKLDQAREQLFYADAAAGLARARRQASAEREALTRLLGLWGEDARFRLAERLPDPPAAPAELKDIEAYAIGQRLDIRAARLEAEALASSLGLTRGTRFINVLDLGVLRNSETGKPRETGYELSLELPLFDWGGARVAKAEALYMRAVNRVAETAVNARSEVRDAYSGYLAAHELALHYRDEIVPLRRKISDEMLLRYNGMLASAFELLADAREQVHGVNAAIEALRDYWIAEAELQNTLGGRLPASATTATPSAKGN